ncbi:MAG: SMC-Scp complex subunit ScpB [Candidatus Riflebacteria bacterium]|nr:SMC-Scp complex subunit ScpB [Candidatus Riflebacteria bacterium]
MNSTQDNELQHEDLLAALEALLFVYNHPLNFEKISEILEINMDDAVKAASELKSKLDANSSTGLQLVINETGAQLATKASVAKFIQKLEGQRLVSLSLPALETLSVIAFKGPITKAEIEAIRGVNCDGVVSTLLEKKLVYVSGEKQVIGRPRLYSVTQDFLYYFGLKSMKDIPVPSVEMPDSQAMQAITDQLSGKILPQEPSDEISSNNNSLSEGSLKTDYDSDSSSSTNSNSNLNSSSDLGSDSIPDSYLDSDTGSKSKSETEKPSHELSDLPQPASLSDASFPQSSSESQILQNLPEPQPPSQDENKT